MQPDILPCPFCGSKKVFAGPASALSYEVICYSCQGRGPEIDVPDRSRYSREELEKQLINKAIKGWNKRAK